MRGTFLQRRPEDEVGNCLFEPGSGVPPRPRPPLTVGISACLAGEAVRYDGADAADELAHDALASLYRFRPICPEVGIGLGVPRPPIRLVGSPPRAVGVENPRLDVSDALQDYARAQSEEQADLCGYIFMSRSPSCGLHDVKRYAADGSLTALGSGLYAAAWRAARPELPVEDNLGLARGDRRESFIAQTFTYAHWQRLLGVGLTPARLVEFHSCHKYLLMAHDNSAYRRLGRKLADLRGDIPAIARAYFPELMAALARSAGRGHHANVLAHIRGHFRGRMNRSESRELSGRIAAFERGEAPRALVLRQLRQLLARYPDSFLKRQAYLTLPAGGDCPGA